MYGFVINIKTIDINKERQEQARKYIKKSELKNTIFILGEVLSIVKNLHEQFDFIFLD